MCAQAAELSPNRLNVVVSDLFFQEVLRDTDEAALFQRVRVDFVIVYASADAEWAE